MKSFQALFCVKEQRLLRSAEAGIPVLHQWTDPLHPELPDPLLNTAPPWPSLLCRTSTYGPWAAEPWHPDIPTSGCCGTLRYLCTIIRAHSGLHRVAWRHPSPCRHTVWCFSVLEGVESSHRQPRLVTWDFYVFDPLKKVLKHRRGCSGEVVPAALWRRSISWCSLPYCP